MSIRIERTAVILLASGLSRRYGWRDKLLERIGGKPLLEHAAAVIMSLQPLVRIAVCPTDRKEIGERLIDRFIIALNKKPKAGLGRSISVGVDVAMKFKPDAIIFAMADMPFIEPWILEDLASRLDEDGVDIAHSGGPDGVRPPTAFSAKCFEALLALDGEDGAKRVIGQGGFKSVGLAAPAPLLLDVDTKEDLELAQQQMSIRDRYEPARDAAMDPPMRGDERV